MRKPWMSRATSTRRMVLCAVAWCGLAVSADAEATGVNVEYLVDVPPAIRSDDSLNDVFPSVDFHLVEGGVSSSLVDGWDEPQSERWRRSNSIVVTYEDGPAHITFDLGPSVDPAEAQLDELTLWMNGKARNWGEKKPTFDGRLLTSRDGESFTPVPGSDAKLMEAGSEQFNAVRWSFDPGAVKGFRYLQVELRPTGTGSLRIEEIDGTISGVEPERSTAIRTGVAGIPLDEATVDPPTISQHIPEPMQVEPLAFDGLSVIRPETGQAVVRMNALWNPGAEWERMEELLEPRLLYGRWEREDGLIRTVRATLEPNHRLVVECDVSLPASAPAAVRYDAMVLPIEEGDLAFEGVGYMDRFAHYANRQPRLVQLGKLSGYVVYSVNDMDLHVFMPRAYAAPSICASYQDGGFHRYTLYSEVDNPIGRDYAPTTTNWMENVQKGNAGEWTPVPGAVQPGQTRRGRFHVALFRQPTRRTIGRIDLEDRPPALGPLRYINTSGTGEGDSQRLKDASFRYTTRDQLLFMGMRLPSPRWDKPGHMINDSPWLLNQPGVVDRLRRAGFGVVCLMMRDFVDVGHGVSHEGDYDTAPPWLDELLDKLTAADIRPVVWWSPRGFLNRKWQQRPVDPIFLEHPDWFRSSASWAGRYQNPNSYKKALHEWIVDKIRSDFRRFPELGGIAFDIFPNREIFVDVDEVTGRRVPYSQLDVERLRHYHDVIKAERPDAWVMRNNALPMDDEAQWIDFGVSEGSAKQMLNELVSGRNPFGRVHGAHSQWAQLYHWMVTLSFMHHNFANFDQGLGWFHHVWLGWHPNPKYQWMRKAKDLDAEVVPLWYLMGKGRRMYVAETAPFIKQTEVRMPDGGIRIVVSSFSPWARDVDVVPRHLPAGAYRVSGTIDTCLEHREIEAFEADTAAQAIRLTRLPGYGIAVLRFDPPAKGKAVDE
jgi:hypothetical protein